MRNAPHLLIPLLWKKHLVHQVLTNPILKLSPNIFDAVVDEEKHGALSKGFVEFADIVRVPWGDDSVHLGEESINTVLWCHLRRTCIIWSSLQQNLHATDAESLDLKVKFEYSLNLLTQIFTMASAELKRELAAEIFADNAVINFSLNFAATVLQGNNYTYTQIQ